MPLPVALASTIKLVNIMSQVPVRASFDSQLSTSFRTEILPFNSTTFSAVTDLYCVVGKYPVQTPVGTSLPVDSTTYSILTPNGGTMMLSACMDNPLACVFPLSQAASASGNFSLPVWKLRAYSRVTMDELSFLREQTTQWALPNSWGVQNIVLNHTMTVYGLDSAPIQWEVVDTSQIWFNCACSSILFTRATTLARSVSN